MPPPKPPPDRPADRPAPAADGGRPARGRKRGRPRIRPDAGALVTVRFKVSAAERDELKATAKGAGLSVSEYLRRRAFGGPVARAAESIVADEVRHELGKIGTNVNQLARRANEAARLVPAERAAVVASVVGEARAVLVAIKEATDAIKTTGRGAARRTASAAPGPSPRAGAGGGAGDADASRVRGGEGAADGAGGGGPGRGPSRALTHSRAGAAEAGLDVSGYEGDAVPEGSWVGRLDFKVWTRTGVGVSCYFTREAEPRGGAPDGPRGGALVGSPGGALGGPTVDAPGGARGRYRLAAFRASGGGSRYTPRDGALDVSDDTVAPGDRFVVTVGRTGGGRVSWLAARPYGAVSGGGP